MVDRQSLINEADPVVVAEYIGMRVVRKGSRNCISCPGHKARLGKDDHNVGNAVLTDKGYHCFACNATVGVIDMVMEFLSCDFKTATQLIAEACGGSERFIVSEDEKIERPITLSREDLEIIGLTGPEFSERHVVNASDAEPVIDSAFYSVLTNGEYIVYDRSSGWSLTKLAQKDNWAYRRLINRKAREAAEKYAELLSVYCSRDAEKAYVIHELFNVDGYVEADTFSTLREVCQKRYERAAEIAEKYEGRKGR